VNLANSPVRIAGDAIPKPPNKFQMGLSKLDLTYWLIRDEDFDSQISLKRTYLSKDNPVTRNQVLQTLPQSTAAQEELFSLVQSQHGTRDEKHSTVPIEDASLLAQEDFCILEKNSQGLYHLTAACVCFPSRWDLPSKLAKNLSQIHQPVPGFEEKLTSPLNRMFANLEVERPVWRQNWALETDTDLHQPGLHFHNRGANLTPSTISTGLWIRSEYQTLRRLPRTQAVVFTIRNFIWPLNCLETTTDKQRLKQQISTMEPQMCDYKSISAYKNAIIEYLDMPSQLQIATTLSPKL